MAGQTDRPTKPITSSDTIALITNTVMPAIQNIQDDLRVVDEIKGDIKVIDNRLKTIESDTGDIHETINKFRITLYGNGNPEQKGLVTIVTTIKDWIDARSAYEKIVIGVVIAEMIGLIFLFIRDAMI